MHAAALSRLDVDSDFIRVWGRAYRRVGRYEANYRSRAGTLRVKRSIYRKVGERNGPTVDPVSLQAGVVEDGWLPRTSQTMAYLLAQGTCREAEETGVQMQRLEYARTSFERKDGPGDARLFGIRQAPTRAGAAGLVDLAGKNIFRIQRDSTWPTGGLLAPRRLPLNIEAGIQ